MPLRVWIVSCLKSACVGCGRRWADVGMRLRGMELSPPEFEVLGADCVHASRNAHVAVLDMPTTAAVFMKSRRDTLPCTYQCFSSSCLSIVSSLVRAVGQ